MDKNKGLSNKINENKDVDILRRDENKGVKILTLKVPEGEDYEPLIKSAHESDLNKDNSTFIVVIKTVRVKFPELISDNETVYGENSIKEFLANL
jgi:hypothetical protein